MLIKCIILIGPQDGVDTDDNTGPNCSAAGPGTSPSLTLTAPTPSNPATDNKTFRQEILIKNADSGKGCTF